MNDILSFDHREVRLRSMRRFQFAEPLVMLATVVQWLVLSIFTGAVIGVGCTIFLRLLFATAGRAYAAPLWVQMLLLPIGGIANGLDRKSTRLNSSHPS